MNMVPHTPDEAEGFEHISDFLYPEGKLDEEALALFLKNYNDKDKRENGYSSNNAEKMQKQMEAMGVLLRLVDTKMPLWATSFERWYVHHRMSNEAYLRAWFSFLDEDHKEKTKTCMLSLLAGAPPVDIRVALMMDGMEHYRELPIQTFIGKSLLRVKSAAFVKALKPRRPQMPMVLRMANELGSTAPEFTELAQAIALGVFVQRMSEKPSASNYQNEYSACEALLLMLDNGVVVEPAQLVKAAKSRFKGSTLLPDMMHFVSWALEPDPSKNWMHRLPGNAEKELATQLMATLMDDISNQPMASSDFDHALVRVHAVLSNDAVLATKIHDWFIRRLNEKNTSSMQTPIFVYMLDHIFAPDEHHALWTAWCQKKENTDTAGLLTLYLSNGGGYNDPERYYELMQLHVSTDALVELFYRHTPNVLNAPAVMANYAVVDSWSQDAKQKYREQYFLGQAEAFFSRARRLVGPDLRDDASFKQLIAAASMTYLLHASRFTCTKNKEYNGTFVNLLPEPLPLLRSLYPEHTNAFNTLRKDIIGGNSKYHTSLYRVLGKALYANNAFAVDDVLNMAESMGIGILDYFRAATMNIDVHFDVEPGMFDAGMF